MANKPIIITDDHYSFASVRQAECLRAIEENGGAFRGAARALGVAHTSVQRAYETLVRKMAMQGISPAHDMTHAVPPGFMAKGVSTLYDADGKVRVQWVKSKVTPEGIEAARQAFVDAMADDLPRFEPVQLPGRVAGSELLLNAFIYGDPHIGLRAWREETGQDHDLQLAERLFIQAHHDMIRRAPAADTALVLNLGDYFHADDGRNVTLRSGHSLDVDGRYQKVRRIGFKIMRAMIDACLQTHQRVIVWNIIGNHDDFSAVDLSLWLQVAYENEPRVHIETSANKFYFHQHGKVMLAATHGDTVKPDSMLGVMAADRPEMWGTSAYRYAHIGHVHHKSMKDLPGVAVETHRVLQPNDLYAHAAGYRGQRDAQCITYHSEYGEFARTVVNPGMFG